MKTRVEAATDVARLAAWDASRNAATLSGTKNDRATLEADAAAGHVFVLATGADAGGPIDVYVDEPIEPHVRERLEPVSGEYLLALPTGALVVNGAEYYGQAEAEGDVVQLAAGDYAVRCYAPSDTEREPVSEAELRRAIGSREVEYYDRLNRSGCAVGAFLLLLFPLLLITFSWMVALPLTILAVLGWFPLREQLLKRNKRYQQLHRIVPEFRLRTADPYLVLELRRVRQSAA